MEPILPFPKDLTATVTSRVKPPKNIESLKNPAIFTVPGLASAIAESTIYPKRISPTAEFFKEQPPESNAAAVFARPPPNNPNRPPTNAELAEIRAEAEAREAANRAKLEQERKTEKRRGDLMRMQRVFRERPVVPIGKIRPQSPGNKTDGGKRKTVRKHKGKKVKKTNKRRH
jgi:hypothetical protein